MSICSICQGQIQGRKLEYSVLSQLCKFDSYACVCVQFLQLARHLIKEQLLAYIIPLLKI